MENETNQGPEKLEAERREEILSKWEELMANDSKNVYTKWALFSQKLRQKGLDANSCELHHKITGSTIDEMSPIACFDFEGEDSIASFVDELYKEYKAGR